MTFSDSPGAAALRQAHVERHAGLYRALFVLFGLALSLLNVFNSLTGLLVTVLPKLLLVLLCAYRFDMLRYCAGQANWKKCAAALMLSVAFLCQLITRSMGSCLYPLPRGGIVALYIGLGVLALPALFSFALCAIGYAADALRAPVAAFFRRMDRMEKVYLIAFCALTAAATVVLFSLTNVFYGAQNGGELTFYDVVYTSDSCSIVQANAYLRYYHMENDLRQPLFALFCMPFSVPAWLLSKLLFFVPNAYAMLMNLVQCALIGLSALMLVRMCKLSGVGKLCALLLYSASYSTMLFSLNMEQYVFATFWLLLFLYLYSERAPGRDVLYIAMTGSLLTSGVFFPLLSDRRPFAAWAKDVLRCALLFFAVVLVFNRQHLFFQVLEQAGSLTGLAGGRSATLAEKLLQYVNMLGGCFVAPAAGVTTTLFPYPSWQLDPVRTLNPVGLIVLALSALGFFLNWNKPFARVCGVWALVSFALHAVLGWGAYENGLMLYTFYYGWAFLGLTLMGLERLLTKLGPWRALVYAGLLCALLACNLPGMAAIVRFGLTYYPA